MPLDMVCTHSMVTSEWQTLLTENPYLRQHTRPFPCPRHSARQFHTDFHQPSIFFNASEDVQHWTMSPLVLKPGPGKLRCYMPTLLKKIWFNKHLVDMELPLRNTWGVQKVLYFEQIQLVYLLRRRQTGNLGGTGWVPCCGILLNVASCKYQRVHAGRLRDAPHLQPDCKSTGYINDLFVYEASVLESEGFIAYYERTLQRN